MGNGEMLSYKKTVLTNKNIIECNHNSEHSLSYSKLKWV